MELAFKLKATAHVVAHSFRTAAELAGEDFDFDVAPFRRRDRDVHRFVCAWEGRGMSWFHL